MQSKDAERISDICRLLAHAERPVRVLRTIAWPEETKADFFQRNARELPNVDYPGFDLEPSLEVLASARKVIDGEGPIDRWLRNAADNIENGARLLAAVGTPDFLIHSTTLYGAPTTPLADGTSTALELARRFDDFLAGLCHVDLGTPEAACHTSSEIAARMERFVQRFFGDDAPAVEIVDHLSANALAGPSRIRIRRNAAFTDKDAAQLINHEALVHVATSLNGRRQTRLPILAASHPGTTRTQEGLAVFSEFITGSMELDRFRRLSDRVIAVEMAIAGADFLDVYGYFLERTDNPEQSYESARRVFRGGVVAGRVPFTKDIVYLDGLLRIHNFFRVAAAAGRSDCLRLLFAGKMDIEDLPALCELRCSGLCEEPRFLPTWAQDLRFLLSYLAYSGFLNSVKLERISAHYNDLFAQAPIFGAPHS